MGQKKPARANRLGIWVKREKDSEHRLISEHESKWFAGFKKYRNQLNEDWLIRQAIKEKYGDKAGISRIQISRKSERIVIDIYAVRPANILGRDNQKVSELRDTICKKIGSVFVEINVCEASNIDPRIIAERIAMDLEKRVAFRKSCKTAISKTISHPDVLGIKIYVSGRLGGVEIARSESYHEGTVPLHTWHANIDNASAEAHTTYGIIGVKVIIHRIPGSSYSRNSASNQYTKERSF